MPTVTPAPADTVSPATESPPRPSDWAAFDVADFEAPFERLPLRPEFVRAHGIGLVTLHRDRRIEDAWLVDLEVITTTFDETGRPTSRATFDRGEPAQTVAYHYEAGRLASTREDLGRGTAIETRHEYDAAGRLTDTWRVYPDARIHEHNHYDDDGVLLQSDQISDEGTARKVFAYEDGRLAHVQLHTPSGEAISIVYRYDDAGRRIGQRQTRSHGSTDDYAFIWSADGRLRSIEFTEDGRLIYRRSYLYDERGRPIEERLESFVPAMGEGDLLRYEYGDLGDLPRRSAAAEEAAPSHADLVNATVAAFTGAYVELAQVSYETIGGDRFAAHAVTVLVPEAIAKTWSEDDLRARACAVKTATGMACDCERVTLGPPEDSAWHSWPDKRVVKLTLDLGIGC